MSKNEPIARYSAEAILPGPKADANIRFAAEMLETAEGMLASGLLDSTAYEKIQRDLSQLPSDSGLPTKPQGQLQNCPLRPAP